MKNILFNSIANIGDDLLDMTAQKIKRAKPRKIALRVTALVAAAAACVFAVNFGVSYFKNKLPVQQVGSVSSVSSSGVNYSENEKYFEPYEGKEFVIDYNNLPFKYSGGELTKLNPDPIVNYTGIGVREILAYDISEYIGNNPWNENLQIKELPVFNFTEYNSSGEFKRISSAIEGTGIKAEQISLSFLSILLSFPESIENFPQNYNDNGKIYADEMKRIADKYSDILGFTNYELDIFNEWVLNEDKLCKFWHTKLYKSSENAFEAILNYNFNSITFYSDSETNTFNMSFPNLLESYECIGFYPIISAKEAREMLIENPNKYYPNMIDDNFFKDGANVDKIKHVELVYARDADGKSLPYYTFYIQKTEEYDGINFFIPVSYPAISPEYLTDKTEQNPVEENNNSSSTEQKAFYDDTFVGMALQGSGPRTTYNEVMDSLTSQDAKDRGIYIDSFYLVETVQALSIEGYDWDSNNSTIYEVKIIRDLISGEDINRTEKILISNGTPKWQYEYDPAYAPGERFTIALGKPRDGKDFIETPGSYMFRYDVPSDGSGYIYSRCSEMDKLNLPTSENIKETVVTSTTQNPAGYSQKVTLDAVADFLRSDWKARGVSSHFDGTAS